MTVEQSNGQGAGTPGWWRVDLAGTPGLDMLPLCTGCTAPMATGYGRVTTFWGRQYLCEECAGGLMIVVAEAKGLEILDKRTDIILEVSRHDVTVTIIWGKTDDLATTEVLVWPAGGRITAAQEADLVDDALNRLCVWLNSYRDALEADQPAVEVVSQ